MLEKKTVLCKEFQQKNVVFAGNRLQSDRNKDSAISGRQQEHTHARTRTHKVTKEMSANASKH